MSFNQDQSSPEEHMGPTDAALIPLGFCLTAGRAAPLIPWSAVRSVTTASHPLHHLPAQSLPVEASTPAGGNGEDYKPSVWSDRGL